MEPATLVKQLTPQQLVSSNTAKIPLNPERVVIVCDDPDYNYTVWNMDGTHAGMRYTDQGWIPHNPMGISTYILDIKNARINLKQPVGTQPDPALLNQLMGERCDYVDKNGKRCKTRKREAIPPLDGGIVIPGMFCGEHRPMMVDRKKREILAEQKLKLEQQEFSKPIQAAPRNPAIEAAFQKKAPEITKDPAPESDDESESGSQAGELDEFDEQVAKSAQTSGKLKEKTKQIKEKNDYEAQKLKKIKLKQQKKKLIEEASDIDSDSDIGSDFGSDGAPPVDPLEQVRFDRGVEAMAKFANGLAWVAEEATPHVAKYMWKTELPISAKGFYQDWTSDEDSQATLREVIREEFPDAVRTLSPTMRLALCVSEVYGKAIFRNYINQAVTDTKAQVAHIPNTTVIQLDQKYRDLT